MIELSRTAIGVDGAVKQTGRFWLCSDRYQLVLSADSHAAEKLFDLRHVERTP